MMCCAVFYLVFLLCHDVQCRAVEPVLCVVLCHDVLGLCYPVGLIKADTQTGCITALMKSVSTDCTQGQLACVTTTQERERERDSGVGGP